MKLPFRKNSSSGFTLIELVVVMGVLAFLLAITLIAVNPGRQFDDARDTQRRSDINAILNAVHQFAANPVNRGNFPAGISTDPATPSTITSTAGAGNVNLCTNLVPNYIADIPLDPELGVESPVNSVCTAVGATYGSGYRIYNENGRITVLATDSGGNTISVTR